jgi:hypothetical protein
MNATQKRINHREDTDLTWKTPLKRRGKTMGAGQQLLTIFGWLQIAGDLQLRDSYLLRLTKIFIEVSGPSLPVTGLRFARQLSRLLQNLDHKLNSM